MKWNGRLPESELELMLAVWEACLLYTSDAADE